MDKKVIDKFWASVIKGKLEDDCWDWKGNLDKYAAPIIRLTVSGRFQDFSCKQISLTLIGQKPKGFLIHRTCNSTKCVNPKHLVFGELARFWAKVDKRGLDGCWIWTAGKDKNGYGKFNSDFNQYDRSHIFSYRLHKGQVPPKMFVCHSCDNPSCVNPEHLWLGTPFDNTHDCIKKNRFPEGETSGKNILTEKNVLEIRERAKNGENESALGEEFGVHPYTIRCVIIRKSWKHLP